MIYLLLPKSGYKRHVVIFFYGAVSVFLIAALGWLVFKVLFPFVCAWVFAISIRPLCRRVSAALKLSKKCGSILVCVSMLTVTVALLGLACWKISDMILELPENASSAFSYLSQKFDDLCFKLSQIFRGKESISEGTEKVRLYVEDMLKKLVSSLTSSAATAAKKIPSAIFSLVIFIISCIYFCADLDRVNAYLVKFIPENVKEVLKKLKNTFLKLMLKYLKASLLSILITFGMIYVGLVLLKYKYAAVIAAAVAVLDFLPAIGIGTVFVPWAIVNFFLGYTSRAVKLLVLFAVCEIANQVIRPKLIGSQLGIHPVAALIGLFVGLKLFGFWGMLLSPIAVIAIKLLLEGFFSGRNEKINKM